jgi:hypothetical protein
MAGDLLGNRSLKGLGAATALAPCPKVFCDIDGYEPFASSFTIVAEGPENISLSVTPEVYSRFKGPYNRRNVYGAAIAGAPRLPESIRRSVFGYAFGPSGPLRNELSLPVNTGALFITVRTLSHGRNETWTFPCLQ